MDGRRHLGVPGRPRPRHARRLAVVAGLDATRGVRADDGELVAMHASYAVPPPPGARRPDRGVRPDLGRRAPGPPTAGPAPRDDRRPLRPQPGPRRGGVRAVRGRARRSTDGSATAWPPPAEPARPARCRAARRARRDRVRLRLEALDPERHGPLVAAVHGSVDRPGWTTREPPRRRRRFLHDPRELRRGGEPLRIALAERDGNPVGYALLRRKMDWQRGGPRGVVRVREICARTRPRRGRCGACWWTWTSWRRSRSAASRSTTRSCTCWWTCARPSRTGRTTCGRGCSTCRRRSPRGATRAQVDVVLEVRDTVLPANAGRWRLRGGPDGAEVTATGAARRPGARRARARRRLPRRRVPGCAGRRGPGRRAAAGHAAPAATAFGWPLAPVASYVW